MYSDPEQGKCVAIICGISTVAVLTLVGILVVDSSESKDFKIGIYATGFVFWLMWFLLAVVHKISFDVSQKIRSLEQQIEELRDNLKLSETDS